MKKIINSSNGKKLQKVGKNAAKIEKTKRTPECNKGSRAGKAATKELMVEAQRQHRLGVQCLMQKLDLAQNEPKEAAPNDNAVAMPGSAAAVEIR